MSNITKALQEDLMNDLLKEAAKNPQFQINIRKIIKAQKRKNFIESLKKL